MLLGLVLALPVALRGCRPTRCCPGPPTPTCSTSGHAAPGPDLPHLLRQRPVRTELRAVGLWQFFREPYFCAILTLTLNTGAYTAEILRGAIRAVPYGEVEAGRAFGMTRALILRRVILPKAFRLALPAYTNEVIFLFQATSLVSIITIMDLTGVGRVLVAESFRTFEIWIFVGLYVSGDVLRYSLRLQVARVSPVRPPARRPDDQGGSGRGGPRGTLTAVPWCRGDHRCGATARVHDGLSARLPRALKLLQGLPCLLADAGGEAARALDFPSLRRNTLELIITYLIEPSFARSRAG